MLDLEMTDNGIFLNNREWLKLSLINLGKVSLWFPEAWTRNDPGLVGLDKISWIEICWYDWTGFVCSGNFQSWSHLFLFSVQFSSVSQSCPTLCDPMNRSMPGLPVHHHLPAFTQNHVHWVSDAIQLSHPLLSPSPPAPNPSQHQSLFPWEKFVAYKFNSLGGKYPLIFSYEYVFVP